MNRNLVVQDDEKPEIKEPPKDAVDEVPESEDVVEETDDDDDDDTVDSDDEEDA